MNISKKDLNLLTLFKVVYEERNLSKTADRMALSQPALSHKLNKLRAEFNDPLFVRAARGLTPTPLAHQLSNQVNDLVGNLEAFYQTTNPEDFLKRDDTLHIYTTDLIEQLLLPTLLRTVYRYAPNVKIVTTNTQGVLPKQALERGECDIAIAGFYQDLPESFYQQKVREESFVVLACQHNRFIKNRMDLNDYLANPHIVTTLTGDLQGMVDSELTKLGKTRNVIAGISSFTAPAMVIKDSEFILTCLHSIASEAKQNYNNLEIYPCPVEIPEVHISQVWHQRTHQDPLRRWLRNEIQQVMKR